MCTIIDFANLIEIITHTNLGPGSLFGCLGQRLLKLVVFKNGDGQLLGSKNSRGSALRVFCVTSYTNTCIYLRRAWIYKTVLGSTFVVVRSPS